MIFSLISRSRYGIRSSPENVAEMESWSESEWQKRLADDPDFRRYAYFAYLQYGELNESERSEAISMLKEDSGWQYPALKSDQKLEQQAADKRAAEILLLTDAKLAVIWGIIPAYTKLINLNDRWMQGTVADAIDSYKEYLDAD